MISARYLDIFLGLALLVSLVCLLYGGYCQSPLWLIAFITGSLAVVTAYWAWFLYLAYSGYGDYPQDVGGALSIVYVLLLLPVLLFYRALELAVTNHHPANNQSPAEDYSGYLKRKPPPRYDEGNTLSYV